MGTLGVSRVRRCLNAARVSADRTASVDYSMPVRLKGERILHKHECLHECLHSYQHF